MNMDFASFGGGGGGGNNGGSSSSFSNLSPLAPPFTLDRSVTKPLPSPLVDMTEPSFGVGAGVPHNSLLHNWVPSTSKTSGFSNSTSEFDWLPFSAGSRHPNHRAQPMIEPSDNHESLLGRITMSSTDTTLYGDSWDGLTTSIGKAKPYYPSYASTSFNKGGPMVRVDQPSYDWLSNSHVPAAFDLPSCPEFCRGSSGSERSVEEASHSIDVLDLNRCNEFVREYPNEELLLERNRSIEQVQNLRMSNIDAHSAFPGCHPKSRTPPSNPTASSRNCQFLTKAPYEEILREQDARLSGTTSIVNSPATFSIRPPVVSTDSLFHNCEPYYGYASFESKQGGNDLSNLQEFLPVNSERKECFSANHDTCIDKNDPVINEVSSASIHDLPNNIHSAKDSIDRRLKTGMGLHIPDASPHFSLDLKTIETTREMESASESFDPYSVAAVDSPCWKGAPIGRSSPFQAFEVATPSRVKTVEVCNNVNLSLSQLPASTAEDTVKDFVHEPRESTIGSILEKGATSSSNMPSVAGPFLPASQKTCDAVKGGEFYSEMGCFHPALRSIHEPVENSGDFYYSRSLSRNKYGHNLMPGKRIPPTSCLEKNADARLNSDNSSENGWNYFSCDAAEHVQNLPFELVKEFHGESISKIDIRKLVERLHSLSELLLSYRSNGLDGLHQKDVKSLETVMSNLDMCINSVRSQGSLSSEQRPSRNFKQFHQLHPIFHDVEVLNSQMTKIEGENLECLSNDRNEVEEKNQYVLSVKKDKEGIDSIKEDSMTKALKKVLSENFNDEEERPQSLLYKNLWLEAEAALCASNLRARFNSAKLEMEKHESPEVREHSKNRDELLVSDVSPGSNTIAKLAPKTKVGSTSFVSVQTSPAFNVSSHAADDVITRFHILKCRDDEAKCRDAEYSGTLPDFPVQVTQDMVEKLAHNQKQIAAPYIKDMDSSFFTSNVKENDSQPAIPPISPTVTRSSHIDDVMSRFQILKSRDEHISSLNSGNVLEISSSEIDMPAPKGDTAHSTGVSTKHQPDADNKNEVDNLEASVRVRLDVLQSRGNNVSSPLAGEKLQYPASNIEYQPIVQEGEGLGVEMESFLRLEPVKESRSHVEGKLPAGYSDGSSSDWEHVLWCE